MVKNNYQGGYIGLISILIAVLIISWWAWVGFGKGKSSKPQEQGGVSTVEIQTIPGQLKTIDRAKDAKNSIENLNKKMIEQI